MARRSAIGLAGLSLAGLGLYAAHRHLSGRALGLRPVEHGVVVEHHLPVPMPDGVTLYAEIYRPRATGPFPTILIRTPYGRVAELGPLGPLGLIGDFSARLFAERGYNVVIQGVRGRYMSEGRFEPFVNEAADGRATLEWVAHQPWFEGNLGMWGPSYMGYTQWAVAADAPAYLKALVPIVISARFSRLFYPDGAFAFESTLRWARLVNTFGAQGTRFGPTTLMRLLDPRSEAAIREALAHQPLAEADAKAIGAPVEFFQRWLNDTDPEGAYWRSVDQHRGLGRVDAAVHLVAGWYDTFLGGQLSDYAALLAAGHRPYLTILPRAHLDTALIFDGVREGLWWFDAHLKGQHELLQRRAVRLYALGAHEWHEMDFWPPPAQITRYYLQAAGALAPGAPAPHSPPDSYRYDPRDPTPSIGGPVFSPVGGPRDQRPIQARGDVLTYSSLPLPEAVDVIGHVRLELYVRSSQAHTDFVGRLCDQGPDGASINVCEGLCRVLPGKGEPQPDGSLRVEIDMWATARRFRKGHRIQLIVCSAAHPRWSANMGDGGPLGTAGAGLPADQTIYHDPAHPSALLLPIVNDEVRHRMGHVASSKGADAASHA